MAFLCPVRIRRNKKKKCEYFVVRSVESFRDNAENGNLGEIPSMEGREWAGNKTDT